MLLYINTCKLGFSKETDLPCRYAHERAEGEGREHQ